MSTVQRSEYSTRRWMDMNESMRLYVETDASEAWVINGSQNHRNGAHHPTTITAFHPSINTQWKTALARTSFQDMDENRLLEEDEGRRCCCWWEHGSQRSTTVRHSIANTWPKFTCVENESISGLKTAHQETKRRVRPVKPGSRLGN